jgi:UDP-N-acetylmuramate dehydrogenase
LIQQLDLAPLQAAFGERLQLDVPLARYTSTRIGGPAVALLAVANAQELSQAARMMWQSRIPFMVLGAGSNMLVSDRGISAVVLLNQARRILFDTAQSPPRVWAESGANTGLIARQAAARSLGGLEWAAGIPGTLGGAVAGNAGAHAGDIASDLIVAEILQHDGKQEIWTPDRLEFAYRSSWLKQHPGQAVVLSATLRLQPRPAEDIRADMDRFLEHRRRTQPAGASMGSMFKNPPGDYAGRLIEAAGLKGTRVGQAEISPLHGNFFLNLGEATAQQVFDLISLAQEVVHEQFGVRLELEIQLIGAW